MAFKKYSVKVKCAECGTEKWHVTEEEGYMKVGHKADHDAFLICCMKTGIIAGLTIVEVKDY